MESPGKRRRGNDDGDAGCSAGDRLSALPDCLLHHIMSFMKARQMVQTCVLSTRWTHLWRSVPCLDVDQEEFKTAAVYNYDKDMGDWARFEDFVDTLLAPCNISIALLDTFRMHVTGYGMGCGRGSKWIRRGIKELGIPRERLSSRSSWRLRRMHLSNLELYGLFAEHVRSRCLSLEDLELIGCTCEFQAITSQSLKNLVLKYCRWKALSEITTPTLKNLVIDGGSNTNDCLLAITAPAVASLFLGMTSYNFDGGLSWSEMPSLAKAYVHLSNSKIVNRFKVLGSVSNVMTSLELSRFETMVPGEGSTILLEFKNLRTLVMDNCDLSLGFQTLAYFLRTSPNLEKLTLRHCKYSNDIKKKKATPKCENLKLTEIIYEDDDVHQLVELLLRISRNLPYNCIKLTKV